MTYVPILKAKLGEFQALQHAAAEVRSRMRPIMELVPDPEAAKDPLETFASRAMDAVPQGHTLTVDGAGLSSAAMSHGAGRGPLARLSELLGHRGVRMRPVVRTGDPDDMLREGAGVNDEHQDGACLRVAIHSYDNSFFAGRISEVLRILRLDPEEIDLLIDAGPMPPGVVLSDVTELVVAIRAQLAQWPWRSECVAAGAFPKNLTGFPRGQATSVVRQDLELWKRVVRRSHGRPPDFGDFGVTHPHMPIQSRGTPDPNMRYTTPVDWQVFVYRRKRPGNDDFFNLSRDLVSSQYWPPAGRRTSWGDEQLHACATRQRPKAGGGTQWRAWATSHHLAVVTEGLAQLDAA
ncbi:beta family protein [Streptomyces sp. NBC_01257]|uniref:beta family protein n=1 Tax=Streptomyces sp. NBC_01257 TaxID=2903799 RepID=UPI002DDA1482|nr:beta family protein [Streptomyces sp. NBC_01257]WRZ67352.1 beta family protein [Streptomyces sp. NBC_01257]